MTIKFHILVFLPLQTVWSFQRSEDPRTALHDYHEKLSDLTGHYSLFVGSDGKVEGGGYFLRGSPKKNIVRPFIISH